MSNPWDVTKPCADCGHDKVQHSGGLGMCNSSKHGFCRCSQYRSCKMLRPEQCTTIAMTTGGEKKHPVIIRYGDKMQWVGMGWVNEGKASYAERKKYPHLIES